MRRKSRCGAAVIKRAAAWPHRWIMGQIVRVSALRIDLDGCSVFDATRAGLLPDAVDTIRRAYKLVHDVAPQTFTQMRTHMPTLIVTDDERTEYVRVMRAAFLPGSLVSGRPFVTIAAVLVGLGARARVSNKPGGWTIDVTDKPRLLRIDIGAQRGFITKLDSKKYSNLDTYLEYLDRLGVQLSRECEAESSP